MNVLHWLNRNVATQPDTGFCRILRGGKEHRLSWGQLHRRAQDWCAALDESGIQAGDVVLLFLPTSPDLFAGFLGAMMRGAIPSIMPPPTPKQPPNIYWSAHTTLFRRLRPAALITDQRVVQQMAAAVSDWTCPVLIAETVPQTARAAAPVEPSEDQIALLQHSSGTTGLKKGVALSHRVVRQQVEAYAASLGLRPSDVIVSWLPLYHDMGLVTALLMPLALGIEVIHLDAFEWAARPDILLDAVEKFSGTHCWLPNFAFEHLARRAEAGPDLSSLKAVINCSEPCRAESMQRFADAFATSGLNRSALHCTYAMAETVFAAAHTPPNTLPKIVAMDAFRLQEEGVAVLALEGRPSLRLVSSGRPIEGVELTIRDQDGAVLPPGRVGEIVLSAPFLFNGYFQDPDSTRRHMRKDSYFSRDRGFLWDGEVYVLGRLDDVLIVNGRNIHAHEIETLAAGVDGVTPGRCAAIGVSNSQTGSQDVVVLVEAEASNTHIRREVRQIIFSNLGLMVHRCEIVPSGWIIKTTSGKVSRDANLDKFLRLMEAP